MSAVYLAEIAAYDVTAGATTTLYYSSGLGFVSNPSSTPADTYFDARMKQPVTITRTMFANNTTRGPSQVGIGSLILNNEDGELDVLADYAFDGRTISVYRGDSTATYPSGFELVWAGTMEDANFEGSDIRIKLRDVQADLDTLVQTDHYDGDNALPAGLEGGPELEGTPKPVAFGLVRNIAPPMVNTSKLIYQVHDAAVDSIDMVFDSGVPIIPQGAFSSRTIPSGFDTAPTAVVWSDEQSKFVLIGAGSGADECATSTDGITWTNQTLANTTEPWWDVAYGPTADLYVVVGGVTTPFLYSSPDGETWTVRTSNFAGASIRAVAEGAGNWVAVGDSGDVSISSDGTTWAAASTPPGGALILNDVIYAFGKWFACTDSEEVYESTDDGDTWAVLYNGPIGDDQLKAMAFGGGTIVVVGNNSLILTCVDGETFEPRTVAGITGQLRDVDYGFGYFMAVGPSGLIATSHDGINWRTYEVGTVTHNGVGFGNTTYGTWVIGSGGTPALLSSTGAGTAYSSEADLLDDSLVPLPGQFKQYAAGGLFRLGSAPQGVVTADVTVESTAAERTAAQLWTDALVKAGKTNMTNVQTEDDLTAWSTSGTPVVTGSIDDPIGGTDAYTVEDNDGAAIERIQQATTFTGDGVKLIEAVLRERTHPSSGFSVFKIFDSTATANRAYCQIESWSAGVPTVSVTTGTLIDLAPVLGGWWRVRVLSSAVTAANTNLIQVEPAATAAATGTIDVFRVRAYDAAALADSWNWLDVERADNDNSAVCGYWTGTEYVPASTVLSELANSVGAWWGPDKSGELRFHVLKDPSLETNWFTFPRELDNAAWTKTRATISADAAVAHDGTTTVDKLVEDSTASDTHAIERTLPMTVPDDTEVSVSFWAKAVERDELRVNLRKRDGSTSATAFVDLTDGTIGTVANGAAVSVVAGPNDDYHITVAADVGSGSSAPVWFVFLSSGSETVTYNGDGSSGLYLWDVRTDKDITLEVTDNDIIGELRRIGSRLPQYRQHLRYRRNYTKQDVGGLAGGVSETRREILAREYEETEATDATVQTRHLNALEQKSDVLLDVRADASTEATRLQTLRGVRRERFAFTLALTAETMPLDIGKFVRITHPRFRLAAGKEFVIMKIQPDAREERIDLEVWG